jgi:hypothetical protein
MQRVLTGHVLDGGTALRNSPDIEFIVPFPYGSNIEIGQEGPEPMLSVLSLMAIDAALVVAEHHPDAKVLVAGETPYGDDLPNTTELMMRRAKQVSDRADAIVPVVRSDGRPNNNTYRQAEAVAEHLREDPTAGRLQNVLTIPLDYHAVRVAQTMGAYGVGSDFVTAEAIFAETGNTQYNRYDQYIDGLRASERILMRIARKGFIPNLLTDLRGARVVDVIEEDGSMKLINEIAQKRLAKLLQQHQETPQVAAQNGEA